MKKILVFQTAEFAVMERIFLEISVCENEVFCVITKQAITFYEKSYPNVHFINVEKEISYDKLEKLLHVLHDLRIDTIYVPSSSPYFFSYNEVFMLTMHLNYRQMILYDCYGNQRVFRRKSLLSRKLEYLATRIWSGIFGFLYQLKYMGYKE